MTAAGEMERAQLRCANRCPDPLPPGARCECEQDHDGPHRNGGLIWHDPAKLIVGEKTT